MDFELWNLTPKEIFRNNNHHQFFFFTFSNFIQAYRQLYYYARKKLTAVTCAYLGNQPSPMRNLPKPLLHYKNSSLFLYPQRKSIWCNKLSKYGRSDFLVFRELASLLKNNLCDFFSAFCRWEYLFNRKVNVCFFQDEIVVSFCPQKIECLHFPHRKKSSQCNKQNRYTEICEYSIRGARTCDNWKRDFLGWAHSGTTDLHMTNQSKV